MWLARVASMLLGLFVLVAVATRAFAKCHPTTDPDRSDIANARAAVAANCDCAGGTSHSAYVSCAAQQVDAMLVNQSCRRRVKKCAATSTCGNPGFVTCCRTKGGVTRCKMAKSAASCQAKGGTPGACSSCCDACPAPGTGPSCPTSTTSISTTTTTTTTSASGDQCCLRTVLCGPFDTCQLMTSAECAGAAGFDVGPGDCSGTSPCSHATTTTPPSACCVADQCVFEGLCECQSIDHGVFMLFRSCTPNPCVTTTTMP